jgi:2-phospho-L-lactate guanylyltransferase
VGGPGWVVVSPVKPLVEAKTRLRETLCGLDRPAHDQLVLAMAQDTVRAALACPVVDEVLIVTDDPRVSAALGELGARVAPDAPASGLNAAIEHGAELMARCRRGGVAPPRGVAAVTADLPALRPEELATVLRAAAHAGGRAYVPDAAGTGTTLLAASPGIPIDPRFGPGSASTHATSGARRLDGYWPSVRCDVDTASDLADAGLLGLGGSTAAVVRQLARPHGRH